MFNLVQIFRQRVTLCLSAFLLAFMLAGHVAADDRPSLTGVWTHDDTRLAILEKTIFQKHCENGRLIWFTRFVTSSGIEWEIYTGTWHAEGKALSYEVRLFERAQSPTFAITRRTRLKSTFSFTIGKVTEEGFEFEKHYGFAPKKGSAHRLEDPVPLPDQLQDKAGCEAALSRATGDAINAS